MCEKLLNAYKENKKANHKICYYETAIEAGTEAVHKKNK
jgi:hypothetical protein